MDGCQSRPGKFGQDLSKIVSLDCPLGLLQPDGRELGSRKDFQGFPEEFEDRMSLFPGRIIVAVLLPAVVLLRAVYVGLAALTAPHFQLRISGRSSPFLSMYCLCSISLCLSCSFR
jgi:hypothetical protein